MVCFFFVVFGIMRDRDKPVTVMPYVEYHIGIIAALDIVASVIVAFTSSK
jgi:hypothetical protein